MSIYDRPKLTQQVRQFGNPALGESITHALAGPSEALLQAEEESLERVRATSVEEPMNPRPEVNAHRDYYRDENDSRSIDRVYTGQAPADPEA